MDIKDDKVYYKGDLLAYLKSKGLPASYPTLLKYEKEGILPPPRKEKVGNFPKKWRVYTGREMKELANKMISMVENGELLL